MTLLYLPPNFQQACSQKLNAYEILIRIASFRFGANKKRNFHDTVDRKSPSVLRVPVQFHFPMIIGLLFIRTSN